MSDSGAKNPTKQASQPNFLSLIVVSLCALTATFFISTSEFGFAAKLSIFVSIAISFLLFCLADYRGWQSVLAEISNVATFDEEIERKLFALEEVNQFFGASLKSGDMFRLIANRVAEIVPFTILTLSLAEKDQSKLKIAYAVGKGAEHLKEIEISSDAGVAGSAFQSGKPYHASDLHSEEAIFTASELKKLKSAIAAPLAQNGRTYGVLTLYAAENDLNQKSLRLLEAVGERVAPLFANSRVFEENLSNALVDALTKLPNERAFYMILENQLAEAQRFRDQRPLTVLTVDIVNFGELNLRYGHSTGDCLLEYAAELIKSQLREMDFLARSSGDEFLAALPTATEQTASEIVNRIERKFVSKPFEISKRETINLELKFGAASFWHDGETAGELLACARLRKDQTQNAENNNILFFPKEYVN